MKCTLEACPVGFKTCCISCEEKEFCIDKCPSCEDVTSCEYQIKPRHTVCKRTSYRWLVDVVVIAMLILLAAWTANLNIMAEDTLNTLADTQRKIDDLRTNVCAVDKQVETEIKNEQIGSFISLAPAEREYITRICMAEAGADAEGNMAVAQVIADRSRLWNRTPLEIVTQKGQFAKPRQGNLYEVSVQAVSAVFDEGIRIFGNQDVTHFHAEGKQKPYWVTTKEYVGSYGENRFYNALY